VTHCVLNFEGLKAEISKAKATGLFSLMLLQLLLPAGPASAGSPSADGTTGLIMIPTAEFTEDGQVYLGAGYISNPYGMGAPGNEGERHRRIPYFVTLGFLPFLEVSLRVNTCPEVRGGPPGSAYGMFKDRCVSVRFRLWDGRKGFPKTVLGVHDALAVFGGTGAIHFNSFYLVLTREIPRLPGASFHLGFGLDRSPAISNDKGITWLKANELSGPFIGTDYRVTGWARLMAEYDTERLNLGIRLGPVHGLEGDLSLLGLKKFGGKLSLSLKLGT